MSVVLTAASEMYLKASTINVSAKPVTFAAWVKSDTLTPYQGIISLTDDNSEWLLIWLRGAVGDNYPAALEYATAWKRAIATAAYTVNTWHHICGVFKDSTSRIIYYNGGSSNENTELQNVNFTLFDQILIGTYRTVTTAFFSGKLACCSIWNTDLSSAQVVSLAAGASPVDIASDNLMDFWPLISNSNSIINSNHLIGYNNPTFDSNDNPSVLINHPQRNITSIKRLIVVGNDKVYYEDI